MISPPPNGKGRVKQGHTQNQRSGQSVMLNPTLGMYVTFASFFT